jgi:hypothetical protein
MSEIDSIIEQARMLVSRLERISVDSIWARRCSGQRGNLLRWIEEYELQERESCKTPAFTDEEILRLLTLIRQGFQFLERAAREVRDPESPER